MCDQWLQQFGPAWARLDPQLAAVIHTIYSRWVGPPIYELSPAEGVVTLGK